MSTPEEPPQLTRRQLRELRNTAANPIITDAPAATDTPVAAPLPRAAEPVSLPEPPVEAPPSEAAAPALTRREVRQRERLRTASVPVITAEVLAAQAAQEQQEDDAQVLEVVEEPVIEEPDVTEPEAAVEPEVDVETPGDVAYDEPVAQSVEDWSDPAARVAEPEPVDERADDEGADEASPDVEEAESAADEASAEAEEPESDIDVEAEPADEGATDIQEPDPAADAGEPEERRIIASDLGSELLRGQPAEVEVPASFDQLLTRGSAATGALSMPNALILSQTPEGGSLVSPVTATGEVLITGTFSLPDTYGSTGTVPGHADGKDVDAVLVDGELPAASSPTPIAASAAISTIKSADEIIRPPAPEKGSRLMVVLAITAGILAVALAGVLIVAITTGVFS